MHSESEHRSLSASIEAFRERYFAALKRLYPKTAAEIASGGAVISPTLLSPYVVPISRGALRCAQEIAEAFYLLRESKLFIEAVGARGPYPASADAGNRGALMSFDFHLAEGDELKLIEINTNASMGAMGDLSYRAQGLENPFASGSADFRQDIVQTFQTEARISRLGREPRSIAIVDRDPKNQRLYSEFLVYRELFEQNGLTCTIGDSNEVSVRGGRAYLGSTGIDLFYCRDVDFYFAQPGSAGMKAAFESGAACVTPNPFEYQALADKARLIELQEPGFLERALPDEASAGARGAIRSCLLKSLPFDSLDPDALWSDRKRWFFKPARAHGGKSAYRGGSISKKTFMGLVGSGLVAQEFAPPPTIDLPGPSGELEAYKYDLRFFVYRGRVQAGLARLYQGQMTNAQTLGGGSACLVPQG